eukprot:340489_1
MKVPHCFKLIIWHTFGGGFILLILRMVLILYWRISCFPSMVKVDFVFFKYILNPIDKKIINVKDPVLTGPITNNPIHMFCFLPGVILMLIFYNIISRILQCIAFILTFSAMNKYYESIFSVNWGRMHLGVEIVDQNEPNDSASVRPNIQTKTDFKNAQDNQDNQDNQYNQDNEQPPIYDVAIKTIAPSTHTLFEEQMEGVHLTSEHMDIKYWLKVVDEIHYEEYYTLFVKNGYDSMSVIKTMNEQELVQIGINKVGHRKKIILAVDKLNEPGKSTKIEQKPYGTCCCGAFVVH